MTKYTVHMRRSGDHYRTILFVNGINCGTLNFLENEYREFIKDLGAEVTLEHY